MSYTNQALYDNCGGSRNKKKKQIRRGTKHRAPDIEAPGLKISGKPGFRKQRTGLWNGAKKQRPLRFTPETAFIHSITIQLLKRYAGSSHLST